MMASSSASTTLTGGGRSAVSTLTEPTPSAIGSEPVQQLVLSGLEPGNLSHYLVTVAGHGPSMAVSSPVGPLRNGRLGHQRPDACIVGIGSKVRQLLLGHQEVRSEPS